MATAARLLLLLLLLQVLLLLDVLVCLFVCFVCEWTEFRGVDAVTNRRGGGQPAGRPAGRATGSDVHIARAVLAFKVVKMVMYLI